MPNQTKIDRFFIFVNKLIRTQLMALRPMSLKGRFTGPRVLANSIPKAGTNLMERALTHTPGMRMAPFRTLLDWDECSPKTLKRLMRLKNGQFILGHLPAHQDILDLLATLDIKTLFLIRDPRDIVVSMYKYINEIDVTHYSHKVIASLPDDHARLTAVIKGIDGNVASVAEIWNRFNGWMSAPGTLVIKYEDLLGEQGGGSKDAQCATIYAIASHLGMEVSVTDMQYIAHHTYCTKSSTFRRGMIGTWRTVFTDDHERLFKATTGDLLIRLGYESTTDWRANR